MNKERLRDYVESRTENGKELCAKIRLGKVDYSGKGRNANPVEMSVSLKQKGGEFVFSASASVWNCAHTDIHMSGQCVDEVVKLLEESKAPEDTLKKARFICDMWQKYHLNDMHAGTPAQEALLKAAVENGELEKASNYDNACRYLEEHGMLFDRECGYRYGTGWLLEKIPEKDLEHIMRFIVEEEVPESYEEKNEDKDDYER